MFNNIPIKNSFILLLNVVQMLIINNMNENAMRGYNAIIDM
jgi:hypothetical protein